MRNSFRNLFLVAAIGAAHTIAGTTYSYMGDLRADATFTACGPACTLGASSSGDDYIQWAAVERDFTVAATSAMTAVTFSYGGGTNGAGASIAPGGFAPYLSIFDTSGNFLASTFFGTTCPPGANTNPATGNCYDVQLDGGVLAPGDYRITISAFENLSFAENLGTGTLADGFTGLGEPGDGGLNYAFDVTLQDASAVPEPGSFLSVAAVVAFGFFGTRGRSRAQYK